MFVTIGRLAEDPNAHGKEAKDGENPNSKRRSQRMYSYIQLDSSKHEPIISRKHAQIKFRKIHKLLGTGEDSLGEAREEEGRESTWVIRDLGSTNGILVNGVRVRESCLRHQDILSFGGAATVELGSSVQTHKRKPVDSIFVYKVLYDGY